MSLRDQLLKSGLVSEDKARKAESDARKQRHRTKKDRTVAAAELARSEDEARRQEAYAARKREQDRALNKERDEQRRRREAAARVTQLIESNRLNEPDAPIPYNVVVDGRYVRSVRVTARQRKLLAMGQIGIARNDQNEYDFPLIPRRAALKLAEICPDRLLLLHPEATADDHDSGEDWGD